MLLFADDVAFYMTVRMGVGTNSASSLVDFYSLCHRLDDVKDLSSNATDSVA